MAAWGPPVAIPLDIAARRGNILVGCHSNTKRLMEGAERTPGVRVGYRPGSMGRRPLEGTHSYRGSHRGRHRVSSIPQYGPQYGPMPMPMPTNAWASCLTPWPPCHPPPWPPLPWPPPPWPPCHPPPCPPCLANPGTALLKSSIATMTMAPTHFRLVPMAPTLLCGCIRECFLVVYPQSPRDCQYRAMSVRVTRETGSSATSTPAGSGVIQPCTAPRT